MRLPIASGARRLCRSALSFVLWATCGAVGCGGDGADAPTPGSDTNWLSACADDDQCGSGLCRCGVCTLSCAEVADCGAVSGARLCLEAGELTATSCRLGFAEPVVSGVCSRACELDQDCGAGGGAAVYCIDGVCLPAAARTPRGVVASMVGDGQTSTAELDAGASAQEPAAPAAGGAARGASGGGAQAGTEAGSSESPSAGSSGGAGGSGGGAGGTGPLGGSTQAGPGGMPYPVPNPQPTCPCTSDWPADRAPPLPGEAEPNAYGLPLGPVDLEIGQRGGVRPHCSPDLMVSPWSFTAETSCIVYSTCEIACAADADCPDGGSGSAQPRCSTTGLCYLDCDGARPCPDGMACVSGTDGAACYWAQDILSRECEGYCRQHPPPHDCPNWCADLLVACNPASGVECCDGLRCTEEGYCDAI